VRLPSVYLFAVTEVDAGDALEPPARRSAPPRRRPPRRPGDPPRRFGPPQNERQKRFRQRTIPLGVVALIAFVVGAIMASGSPEQDMAKRFVGDWASQDFAAMYDELSPAARQQYTLDQFTQDYKDAQTASTAVGIDPGDASGPVSEGGTKVVKIQVGVSTNLFGTVQGDLSLPLDGGKIAWAPHLTFPGLNPGERVGRRLQLGSRASILAADGTPLAEGDSAARTSPLGTDAIDVAGQVGDPDAELAAKIATEGYPADQPTGVSGLELAFNARLAGKPGGDLLAVPEGTHLPDVPAGTKGRILATATAKPGKDVKTTIDSGLQQTAVGALAGQSGGVVLLNARTGAVKALAGSAFSSPQPPGSTFKVVTTTAGLEEGKVNLHESFPVVQEINAGGRVISNAHDEYCGGTFVEAFAMSCNTVFAPLGVEIGAEPLVRTAERYGFNHEPSLYNAAATAAVDPPQPSIPENPGTDVDLAATAIGQGQVLATPLNMASIAQTVANGGVRKPTPIVSDPKLQSEQKAVRVTSTSNTRILRSLMEAVVSSGTGTAGALPGVTVAGKTGTAELGPKPNQPPPQPVAPGQKAPEPEQILDAWFIAFAPAEKPKYAIGVMLIDASGDGGEVAAPIAHDVLAAALL
jgi:peptidoglycan glycosyltransferase